MVKNFSLKSSASLLKNFSTRYWRLAPLDVSVWNKIPRVLSFSNMYWIGILVLSKGQIAVFKTDLMQSTAFTVVTESSLPWNWIKA